MFTLNRWNYPSNNNGAVSGINDSGIETFSGTKIKSLAREICQNSLDANIDDSLPTRVVFRLFEIPVSSIPDIDGLKQALKRASEFGPNQRTPKAKEFFDNALKATKKEKIVCMRISDFNTSGLSGSKASDEEPSPWRDLTKSQGASEKSGSNGGSFGIGKFAPYACSSLRTVFYSTLDSSGTEAYQGVSRLTSFKDDEGDTKQGVGFYGKDKNSPIYEQFSLDPDFSRSSESGTDLFILGFVAEEEWKEKMIASVLDGFLYAVHTGKLVVDVDGIVIDKDSLADTVSKYQNYCEEYAKEYYKALTSTSEEDAKVFEEDILSMGKVTLYLILQHDMHRKVAMVRKTGMKILDRGHISGLIKFSGLLYIEGEELNVFLRTMENPQHTKWEYDRTDDPKKAKTVIKALGDFIRRCLEELKNDSSDEALDPSVGEYLTEERDEGSPEEKAEGLTDEVKEIRRKVVVVRKPKEDDFSIPGEGTTSVDDEDGDITEDDVPGTGGREGDGTPKHGNGGGDSGFGNGGGPHPTEHKKSSAGIAPSKLRIMADNSKTGSYMIQFTPSASAEDCSLALFLSAESDKYNADIVAAENSVTGETLEVSGNSITKLTFTENETLKIKVTINYKDYCSMEVRAYGHKV